MVSFLSNRQWTIAVIVGFLLLLLSLGAVLLVFPALTTAQCEPQLTVQNVLTQDAGGTEQTAFAPGETIRFVAEVNNAYGGWMLGSNGTELAITTSFYNAANPVDIPPGVSTWTWEATAPSTAGEYTVEIRVYDSFCGISGGRGNSFTVGEPEATPPPDDGGGTDLTANAGPDQTVPGPSPVAVQFDGSGSTGDIVRYQWYNQYGLLLAEEVTPVIEVNFGYEDPQPGTQRTFTLVVEDSQGNTAQDQVTITLGETTEEETPPPEAQPTITLDPTEGPPGTEVTVIGSGWIPGETVSLQFAANLENGTYHFLTDWYALGETAVGDDGSFTVTFPVPADAKIGEARVAATSADGLWFIDPLFQVTEPGEGETDLVANAGPDQTVPGPSPVTVQLDGSGSTGDIVRYLWYNQYGLLRAEEVTPVIEVNFGYNDPQPGTQRTLTLVVEDSQGNTAQDQVTITLGETEESDTEPPTVSWVKPVANLWVYPATSGTVELEVTASDSSGIRSVEFYWYGHANDQLVAIGTDSSAPYQASVEVDTLNMKWNEIFVEAEDTAGNRVKQSIFIYHLNPAISLDTAKGAANTKVTAQGSGWFPKETVIINLGDPANKVGQATVDDAGNFEATFTVPAHAVIGEQKVIAITALPGAPWQAEAIFQVVVPPTPTPTPTLVPPATPTPTPKPTSTPTPTPTPAPTPTPPTPKPAPTPTPPSSISGKVTDSNKKPVTDITISDGAGHTAKTGKDGTYRLSGLAAGTYTLTPSKQGYTFSPASRKVKVPPDATGVDFIGTATRVERKVVVFLEGLGSDLTQTEMDRIKEACYGNNLFASIKLALNDFKCNDFLYYSYIGGSMDEKDVNREWHPSPYQCNQTGQSLTKSIKQLRTMLADYRREHAEIGEAVQFVLIGHSLGGVIALETTRFIGQDPGLPKGSIAAVVTIDSPLNHISSKNLEDLRLIEQKLVLTKLASCGKRHIGHGESIAYLGLLLYSDVVKELANVTDANQQRIRKDKEALVSAAQKNGVKFMTIGNDDDCLWFFGHCELARSWQDSNLSLPGKWIDDRSTMWIANTDYKSPYPENLYPLGKQGCNLSGNLSSRKFLCLADTHMVALHDGTATGQPGKGVVWDIAKFIGTRDLGQ